MGKQKRVHIQKHLDQNELVQGQKSGTCVNILKRLFFRQYLYNTLVSEVAVCLTEISKSVGYARVEDCNRKRLCFFKSLISISQDFPNFGKTNIKGQLIRAFKNYGEKFFKAMGYKITSYQEINDLQLYYNIYGEKAVLNKNFVNFGSDKLEHPAWLDLDLISRIYENNNPASLSEPLPVKSHSAEVVYISHVLEHMPDDTALSVMKEAHRILKKSGILRVVTPDIDRAYNALMRCDRAYFCWADYYSKESEIKRIKLSGPMNRASTPQIFLYHFAAGVSYLHADSLSKKISDNELKQIFLEKDYEEALDYCTSGCSLETQKNYPFNHINWWNEKKLTEMLQKAGFTEIRFSGYGQSYSPVLRNLQLFDTRHPKSSLYMEAAK